MNRYIYTILIMSTMALLVGSAVGQDATAGKAIFDGKCAGCHTTGPGPTINMLSNVPPTTITKTVRNGISPAMPAFNSTNISDSDLNNLAAYITSQSTSSSNATNITTTPYGTISNVSNVTETPYNETNETNATTTSVAPVGTSVSVETPETTTVEATIPVTTPITTIAETPVSTPAVSKTPASPGFDIFLGIIGILLSVLLIYRLKQK